MLNNHANQTIFGSFHKRTESLMKEAKKSYVLSRRTLNRTDHPSKEKS